MAAIFGLGFNEGAYMAEIVRAGIISVDEGQDEAAQALGMTRLQTMRRIVLPQAMRVIIPPTGNETISMLKTTSLVSVIAFSELLYQRAADLLAQLQDDRAADRRVASGTSFFTSILTIGQYYIERYYARGSRRAAAAEHARVLRARTSCRTALAARGGRHACRRARRRRCRTGRSGTHERGTPMVEAEGVHKRFGRTRGAQGHRLSRSGRAR